MIFSQKKEEKNTVPKELPSLASDIIKKRDDERKRKLAGCEEISLKDNANYPSQPQFSRTVGNVSTAQAVESQQPVMNTNMSGGSWQMPDKYSYFSQILNIITKETTDIEKAEKFYREGMVTRSMLEGMKKHWEEQRDNILFTSEEMKLKEKLLLKINSLQQLEKDWQNHHLQLIEKEERIRGEEEELKADLRRFKELCTRHISERKPGLEPATFSNNSPASIKTHERHSNIRPEHYFRLKDGKALGSVYELKEALKGMTNETFTHHVNDSRNDFASWVEGVFNDRELSEKIKAAKARGDVISLLEKVPNAL